MKNSDRAPAHIHGYARGQDQISDKFCYILHMNIQKIKKDQVQFLSLTSLYESEFDELLVPFSRNWVKFFKYKKMTGKRRIKPLTARQIKNSTRVLPSVEEKLFFILYFFKNGHIQQSLSAQFNMTQSNVSQWIKVLTPILSQSIVDLHLQAAQTIDDLVRLFRNRQRSGNLSTCEKSESLHLDATERMMERNLDQAAQKFDYSGKKGGHTLKNSVISDEFQFVHFAGFTHRGAIHDKTMAKDEIPDLERLKKFELWFSKDKAYQGYLPSGVNFLEPFKAKRNHPLKDWQKRFNRWISSIRICSEHAICGIKRCRILKDKLRYFDSTFRNQLFLVACGLHNLRVTRRKISYANGASRIRARMNIEI